jgi:hypothetical protein
MTVRQPLAESFFSMRRILICLLPIRRRQDTFKVVISTPRQKFNTPLYTFARGD